jgi:hypothetical protein
MHGSPDSAQRLVTKAPGWSASHRPLAKAMAVVLTCGEAACTRGVDKALSRFRRIIA